MSEQNIKNINGKRALLAGIFLLFYLILAQQLFHFITSKPLSGDIVPLSYSNPNVESWFNGTYQENTNAYLNENFGFRSDLVRLNNQIQYSLFHATHTKEVILGKEDYVYVEGYINEYLGKNFIGHQAIRDTVANIKFLQDTLRAMGKTLLVVLAPGKPRIYPEYLPDEYVRTKDVPTTYSAFCEEFKRNGINYIDFNEIFRLKKDTARYSVFPQLGVHWSVLEDVRAMDTILGKLSSLSGKDLPRIKITKIVEKNTLESPDDDIIKSMNLIWYPRHKKMAYPEYEYITKGKVSPNLLVIGDSFWWDILLRNLVRETFELNNFWYYNREACGNYFFGKKEARKEPIVKRILQNDMVILISGESTLPSLGFGFIGSAAHEIKRPVSPDANELKEIKELIKSVPDWLGQIEKKAKERSISVDSMLTLDALWYFRQKGPVIKKITIQDVKNSIDLSPEWAAGIEKDAKERNISIDSAKMENAIWFFNNGVKPKEREEPKLTLEAVISTIKGNPDWMKDITQKAKTNNRSIDEQIRLDAVWYLEQQK